MNFLFFMDPCVYGDGNVRSAAFNAQFNLNPTYLASERALGVDIDVRFVTPENLVIDEKFKKDLRNASVETVLFEKREIQAMLAAASVTAEQVVSGSPRSSYFAQIFKVALARKLGDWAPDFVICWEHAPKLLSELFPQAIVLEAHHSGFHRITNQRDVLFRPSHNGENFYTGLRSGLEQTVLSEEVLQQLESYKKTFKRIFSYENHLDRKFLDPDGRFKKLILLPGHLETFRRSMYSHVPSERSLIELLLRELPTEVAIVYSPHPLSMNARDGLIIDDRVIDLGTLQPHYPNVTINVLDHVDAVINISSNIAFPAFVLEKPVFDLGGTWIAEYCSGRTIENLKQWVMAPDQYSCSGDALRTKIVHFLLTRKVPVKFFQTPGVASKYFRLISDAVKSKAEIDHWLPIFNSVRGAEFELEQSQLKHVGHLNSPASPFGLQQFYIRSAIMDPSVKVVGFDIFDTMLCRPLLKPTDVFELMSVEVSNLMGHDLFDFKATRIAAEAMARERNRSLGMLDVNLTEIYSAFQSITKIDDAKLLSIMEMELQTERKILRPRLSIIALYDLAKAYKKETIVISDMYLSSGVLKQLLADNGYTDTPKLYVSNEHNCFKRSGELFKVVLSSEKVNAEEMVFIGDTLDVDVNPARNIGINAFHYPKAVEIFAKTKLAENVLPYYIKGAHYGFHLGQIANAIFDDPFIQVDVNTLFNRAPFLLGYAIFGPLGLSTSIWLAEHVGKGGYDKVFFFSRDGYLIKEIFDLLNVALYNMKLPESVYFYASRKASVPLYLTPAMMPSLFEVYRAHPTATVGYYLENFFQLEASDPIVIERLADNKLTISDSVHKRKSDFLLFLVDNAEWLASRFTGPDIVSYAKQCIGVGQPNRIAFFDVGTRATTQKLLSHAFGKRFDTFLIRQVKYKMMDSTRVFSYMRDRAMGSNPKIASVNAGLCEVFLGNPYERSVDRYGRRGDVIVPEVRRQEFSHTQFVQIEAQRGAKYFCSQHVELFGKHALNINDAGRDVYTAPLEALSSFSSEREVLEKLKFSNPLWLPGEFPLSAPSGIVKATGRAQAVSIKKQLEPKKSEYLLYFIFGSASKYQKFKRSPKRFFSDVKNPVIRQLKLFFRT
ncbi:HAD hydrolase [Agrobacterium sp. DSM 25558]|uniref:hypothetical protein n=1 Tax=Agrobacterium sp. DSM 25558 TaxID=1907665 RepID=UPI0009725EAB|nr:hypothetical protein [Agrobacterium sp. DSM 25558]SCX27169.1 HAD hydrolase [Agrobacterium sp. DSM 25558]